MNTLAKIFMVAALLLTAACSNAENSNDVIGQTELLSRINDGTAPLILDTRSTAEFNSGHVPGATHLPYDNYQQTLASMNLKKDREVIVYCEKGGRAKKVEQHLRGQGFFEVRHLEGDMSAWRDAELVME